MGDDLMDTKECILARDFSDVERDMKNFEEVRNKKINLWRSYQDYINILEEMYRNENDSLKKYNLKNELKRMLKQQKQFAVESLLERKLDDPFDDEKIKVRKLKKSKLNK